MLSQAVSALTSIAMLALKPALVVVGVMLALLAVGLCKSWRAHRRVVSKRTREGSQLLDAEEVAMLTTPTPAQQAVEERRRVSASISANISSLKSFFGASSAVAGRAAAAARQASRRQQRTRTPHGRPPLSPPGPGRPPRVVAPSPLRASLPPGTGSSGSGSAGSGGRSNARRRLPASGSSASGSGASGTRRGHARTRLHSGSSHGDHMSGAPRTRRRSGSGRSVSSRSRSPVQAPVVPEVPLPKPLDHHTYSDSGAETDIDDATTASDDSPSEREVIPRTDWSVSGSDVQEDVAPGRSDGNHSDASSPDASRSHQSEGGSHAHKSHQSGMSGDDTDGSSVFSAHSGHRSRGRPEGTSEHGSDDSGSASGSESGSHSGSDRGSWSGSGSGSESDDDSASGSDGSDHASRSRSRMRPEHPRGGRHSHTEENDRSRPRTVVSPDPGSGSDIDSGSGSGSGSGGDSDWSSSSDGSGRSRRSRRHSGAKRRVRTARVSSRSARRRPARRSKRASTAPTTSQGDAGVETPARSRKLALVVGVLVVVFAGFWHACREDGAHAPTWLHCSSSGSPGFEEQLDNVEPSEMWGWWPSLAAWPEHTVDSPVDDAPPPVVSVPNLKPSPSAQRPRHGKTTFVYADGRKETYSGGSIVEGGVHASRGASVAVDATSSLPSGYLSSLWSFGVGACSGAWAFVLPGLSLVARRWDVLVLVLGASALLVAFASSQFVRTDGKARRSGLLGSFSGVLADLRAGIGLRFGDPDAAIGASSSEPELPDGVSAVGLHVVQTPLRKAHAAAMQTLHAATSTAAHRIGLAPQRPRSTARRGTFSRAKSTGNIPPSQRGAEACSPPERGTGAPSPASFPPSPGELTELIGASTSFGLMMKLVRRVREPQALERLRQAIKAQLDAGELLEYQADLLCMAVNAQLHPERFRPIDEATAKQVIRDCVKRQLGSANQDNGFMPAHLVDRAMQYANRDPSQDPSRSPVAQQWMSPNLSPVTSALGSLPPRRSPTALPYGVSPTTPEQKFAMEKEALLKRLREEHKRYMAGLQEEIRAETADLEFE